MRRLKDEFAENPTRLFAQFTRIIDVCAPLRGFKRCWPISGNQLSKRVAHESDEVILLTIFGLVLVIAGVAQRFQVRTLFPPLVEGCLIKLKVASLIGLLSLALKVCIAISTLSIGSCPGYLARVMTWDFPWSG